MSASVTVRRHEVTLRIRDLDTGAYFTTTQRAAGIDVSSADWIVEAPSACGGAETCQTLPLTNFGDVAFASASATARSHTGAITDPDWTATALELRQSAIGGGEGRASQRERAPRTMILATPSPSTSSDGAFSVSWHEQTI